MNNDDSISNPLNVMKSIYNNGKSIEELSTVINAKYIAMIKKKRGGGLNKYMK